MQDSRPAGLAVLVGTVLMLVTMALHPSGAELLGDYEGTVRTNTVAHGIALLAVPLLLFGMQAFTALLDADQASPAARMAFVVFAVASFCVVIAGTASGLLAPALAARIVDGNAPELWRALYSYNGLVNQAFATLYVVGSGIALLLWSSAAWAPRVLPRWLVGLGVLVGIVFIALMLGGPPHLDVHTFGAIVLAQAIWSFGVGVRLVQRGPRSSTGK